MKPTSPKPISAHALQIITEEQINAAARAANVAMWSTCPETDETWVSETWFTMLGYSPHAFAPSSEEFYDLLHPDDRESTLSALNDLLEDRTEKYTADFRLKAADGSWRWIGTSGAKVARKGAPYLIYGMQFDISWRKETEERLEAALKSAEESRSRLSRLAENAPVALVETQLSPERSMEILYSTKRYHSLLGITREELKENPHAAMEAIVDEDLPGVLASLDRSLNTQDTMRHRFRVKRPDLPDGTLWIEANANLKLQADGTSLWFSTIRDASVDVEREQMMEDARDVMTQLALHDGLTGLPNRRRFDELLYERANITSLNGPAAVLIRIDLDRFKFVNDSLGHAAGDAVLCHVADILKEASGAGDEAFRVGGDEFCILVARGKSLEDAIALVETIQFGLESPCYFDGKTCRFGASFGIASSDDAKIANGDLMSFADAALYKAKETGRGRVQVLNTALRDTLHQGRRLAADLELAVENRDFVPFFHPQICAETGMLVGAEVLARWRTQNGKLIYPETFLPMAEQIRVVPMIDALMVEETIQVLDAWKEAGFSIAKLAFNVSSGRLHDSDLIASVRPVQARGVQVAFELLESILLDDDDEAIDFALDLIRDAKIHIEMDDFGTGHASILGLLHVRPDVLKIDRRLTANVVHSDQARDLVSSILGIARSVGISSLAEGVETPAQANVLRKLGCRVLQGYLYTRPLDADQFLQWAKTNHQNAPKTNKTEVG